MIISFNTQALSAFGDVPSNLSWSLSGGSDGFNTVELTGAGVIGGKQVRGIAFDSLTSPASGTGLFATLSAGPGTTFRVDRAYNGSTFGIIFTDYSSSLFTCITGTSVQSLTANDFNTVIPEVRRQVHLGYR
jgi:hypothetical protein